MEPFCGGCNIIDKIQCRHRFASDNNPYLIAMWNALAIGGWQPPDHISLKEYTEVRQHKSDYPDYYVGYVGFHATYGAKFFGGYARPKNADGTLRDQSSETRRNTMKQIPALKEVSFNWCEYWEVEYENAVIYCDPPYAGTTKFSSEKFDYEKFWDWIREQSRKNIVIVSEYNAPEDFRCIWQKETIVNFDYNRKNKNSDNKRAEKLFVHESILENNKI